MRTMHRKEAAGYWQKLLVGVGGLN